MNSSVYIFGNLSAGYTQYPDEESASAIFRKFYTTAKATTQVAIHREGNLMYYSYIRKLEEEKYIGLCVLLNGAAITQFDGLFSLFENVISNLVIKGYLIKYDESGNLTANASHLYLNREEFDVGADALKAGFDVMQSSAVKLPPVNYAVSSESVKEFVVGNDADEILKSSYTNGYTYIYKSKGFNTALMNSYHGVLSKISKENAALKSENNALKDENRKIRRQKQQFLYVILLFVAVIACGVGIFFLNQTLNKAQSDLDAANNELNVANSVISVRNDTIASKNSKISDLDRDVYNLKVNLNAERNQRVQVEDEYESFRNSVNEIQPLIVDDTSFNFSSGWFSFDYYGLRDATVTVRIKAFGDTEYSNSSVLDIEEGYHSASIYLSDGLNKDEWYSFYLLIGDKIVGGGRH